MLELILHDSKIMPQECEQIASSELVCELKTLDLSCNPIGLTGLFSLFHNEKSNLRQLEIIELYDCDIKAAPSQKFPAKLLEQECL